MKSAEINRGTRKSVFYDTDRAVQLQRTDRGLNFRNEEEVELYYPCSKAKAQISCAVTAQLVCSFDFAHAKSCFAHDAAQLSNLYCSIRDRIQ